MTTAGKTLFRTMAAQPLRPYRPGWYRIRFQAMGTGCQLCFAADAAAAADEFRLEAFRWLASFEARLSRFIPDSIVSRLNREAGGEWVKVDAETEEIFSLCDHYHWLTGGVFDPSALPLIRLWDYHRSQPTVPAPAEMAAARALVAWGRVQRKPGRARLPVSGMGIDLGGIGKEFAVDRIVLMATARGIANIIVDFGHDLRVTGHSPDNGVWRIGIEDPFNNRGCWGGLALAAGAATTSGDYLRNFTAGGKRYGHILDPRTARPVDNGCRAITIVAPSCVEAGTLATAAFILGADDGLALIERYTGVAGCIVTDNGRLASACFGQYCVGGSPGAKRTAPTSRLSDLPVVACLDRLITAC